MNWIQRNFFIWNLCVHLHQKLLESVEEGCGRSPSENLFFQVFHIPALEETFIFYKVDFPKWCHLWTGCPQDTRRNASEMIQCFQQDGMMILPQARLSFPSHSNFLSTPFSVCHLLSCGLDVRHRKCTRCISSGKHLPNCACLSFLTPPSSWSDRVRACMTSWRRENSVFQNTWAKTHVWYVNESEWTGWYSSLTCR